MLQVCDRDDVSKVTLPAWPGQGYDAIWLSSGLLVQFVFLSVLGYYFASAMIWIFVLYTICILGSLESLLYIYVLLGSIVNYCNVTTYQFHPHRVYVSTCTLCLVGVFESFLCGFGGNR